MVDGIKNGSKKTANGNWDVDRAWQLVATFKKKAAAIRWWLAGRHSCLRVGNEMHLGGARANSLMTRTVVRFGSNRVPRRDRRLQFLLLLPLGVSGHLVPLDLESATAKT